MIDGARTESAWEGRVAKTMRSRGAGIVGLLLGLITLSLLVLSLVHAAARGKNLLGQQTFASIVITLAGFGVFHIFAISSLSILAERPARSLWSASQLAKYLPAPGASLGGMLHSSVRGGLSPRQALFLTLRHSGVLLGSALAVGAWSVGALAHNRTGFPEWAPVLGLLVLSALVLLVSVRHLGPRNAWRVIAAALAGWIVLGLSLWLGIARGHSPGVVVSSSFPAAWAMGFIVLPVPAGIGIREAALLFLLRPWLGQGGAAAFAILSRLLQIGSDGVLVAGDFLLRQRRARVQP